MSIFVKTLTFLVLIGRINPALAGSLTIPISGQLRIFPSVPQFSEQHYNSHSIAVQPKFSHITESGENGFDVELFYRDDEYDEKRSHGDIRELSWNYSSGPIVFKAGISKVFWGVTETQHLVDIINQTDTVEDISGDKKLGQPMLQLTHNTDSFGAFNYFVMSGFRKRTFPGVVGRLRTQPVIDNDNSVRESDQDLDLAARWAHQIKILDFAVSHFYGTSREPLLSFDTQSGKLIPTYDLINQTGFEFQFTFTDFLLKTESIVRRGTRKLNDFWAITLGGEYTIANIKGTELGLILEYSYDDRGDVATSLFQDDTFIGIRWSLNDPSDTHIFAGSTVDNGTRASTLNIRLQRRLVENWQLKISSLTFFNVPDPGPYNVPDTNPDPLAPVQNDSYFEINLTRYVSF